MPPKIVLILNHAEREIKTVEKVRSAIQKINPQAEVHILEYRDPDFAIKTLDINPHIIMTFPFTAISTSYSFYILKHALNCVLICFRAEGLIIGDTSILIEALVGLEKYGNNFIDYEVFWGRNPAQLVGNALLERNKVSSIDRIKYFGCPFFEDYTGPVRNVEKVLSSHIRSKLGQYQKEKILLFVTGFSYADYSPQEIIGCGDQVDRNAENAQEEFEDMLLVVERTKKLRQMWIDSIIKNALNYPELLFIIKTHPQENAHYKSKNLNPYSAFQDYKNILLIIENIPFSSIIHECGILFHYASTTMLEAYLSKIPSVCIYSKELRKIHCKRLDFPNELEIYSTTSVDIGDIPSLISSHVAEPIQFKRNESVEKYLEDQINLKIGENYNPSERIAHFLLSLIDKKEKAQEISPDDKYLINSIRTNWPGQKIIRDLINKGISKIQNNEFQDALTTYLDKTLKLAQAGQLKVQKLQYFRSICLGNMGLIDDAITAIKQELADNPDDSQAQDLYRQLQSVPQEKKKNETQYPEEFTRLIPETFAVETILGCDLKCPECAVGGDFVTRKKGWMQFDQFKIIADKIRPFCKHLYLHIWGEPMLNKDIFKMIEYASAFTSTNISTNGKSMTEEKAERLIRSGVTDIIVSIDGVSQEVYEKYRVGGRVEKAVEALKMLQHFNQKYGNKVHIMPQFIVMKHNHHEMNGFRNLSESLGLRPLFKSPYIRDPNSHFSASDDPRFQRPCYPDMASLRAAMCECDSVRKAFNILVDGSVVACCHDYEKFTFFGNMFEQDVMGIWNSEKYKKFRWNVMSGKAPKFCRERCMSYFLEHPEQALTDEHKDQVLAENPGKTELHKQDGLKINLCSGSIKLEGYVNIDIFSGSDIILDLEKDLLPFPDNSADIVACISAINYFSRQRASEIIKDVHRVLKPGGIARFGTQDLHILAKEYLKKDSEFYSQKLPDGRNRFPGKTIGDKFNEFFYGFQSGNKHCKYVYDFESLKVLFEEAGFSFIEQKNYRESLIPQVAQLDNRPEQMFFLEAIKDKTNSAVSNAEITRVLNEIKSSVQERKTEASALDSMRNQAFRLWETNEKERAWQLLLKVLELQPDDRQTVLKCAEILGSLNKFEDLLKLCTSFLNLKPDDAEIRRIAGEAQNRVKENSPDSNGLEQRRLELRKFNEFSNAVHPDETHLSACMQWLIKAQDVNTGGGVSAAYHMDSQRWDVDYPETTGYIIPTFLCYSKLTGDASYRKRAIDMGNWEIAIQSPEGGAGEPVGVYGLRPRVFNTGQVIIGWVALYAETGDQKYLQAARKAADWIMENQDPDGKWTKSTYSGPKAYKSRVAWALLELYGVSKEEKYRIAVERSVNWIFSQASANAWFANNSLSDPGKPWTHLVGYVLVGLMEIYRLNINNPQFKNVLNLLHHAAKNISMFYAKLKEATQQGYFSTLPGTLDSNWSSSDNWSCVTGNAQIEFFMRRMSKYTNDPSLKSSADMLLNDLKMFHLLGSVTDPNISGGLAGSCPVGGPYLGYSIPNWGVKFFADSLLQRLLPEQEQKYLG
ncbi:Radical SAM domain-containing protein [Desulfonema magnum]|uniref:Radical SAM domain-containing protein n=2 Tax=Desulfonema magnum TaxID=45655 RepID=A0A975BN14_9BACT|nr:Radical SAM domain-containing protein [Desulfonema magnum]